jgi:hypothetical protein
MKALALSAALLLLVTASAGAQELSLAIGGGRVTLAAENVPVRRILEEWARVGGATVVNGDQVGGGLVTLELENVPEQVALDIVLRNTSGYLVAPRTLDSTSASVFNRIVVLASSTGVVVAPQSPAARAAAAARAAGGAGVTPVPQRVVPTRVPTPPPQPAEPAVSPNADAPAVQEPPVVQPRPVGGLQIPPGASDRPGIPVPAPEDQ